MLFDKHGARRTRANKNPRITSPQYCQIDRPVPLMRTEIEMSAYLLRTVKTNSDILAAVSASAKIWTGDTKFDKFFCCRLMLKLRDLFDKNESRKNEKVPLQLASCD